MKIIAALYFLTTGIIPESAWQVAAQTGFNAVLVLILITLSYLQRKDERADREKDRRQLSLLTRSVTEVVLAMAFLPKQFHDGAKDINRQLDTEDEKR